MSPDQPDTKPRKARPGHIVYPLGEEGNSPPFVVVEDPAKKPRQKRRPSKVKAKRKAARKAKRKNRAA